MLSHSLNFHQTSPKSPFSRSILYAITYHWQNLSAVYKAPNIHKIPGKPYAVVVLLLWLRGSTPRLPRVPPKISVHALKSYYKAVSTVRLKIVRSLIHY